MMLLAAFDPRFIWNYLPFTQGQFTLSLVLGTLGLLTFTNLAPDVVLILGVCLLVLMGILTPGEALSGMSNEGMITVAILFVVGAGVQQTGGVDWIAKRIFGRPKTALSAISRLVFPTMFFSAFMNNTPLVAMLIPAVGDLARRERIPASKLMIPLSYAAILGGTCTLIGTSTNLVVQGMWIKEGHPALGMFDITWVGLPAALIGALYIIFAAHFLLPDRRPAVSTTDDPREYTVEMHVQPGSPLAGKSIENAGLRHLPGLFLAEIEREGVVIPAVSPQEILHGGDRLLFVGNVESVVELQKIRGLAPATDEVFKLSAPRPQRCLIEAVVSNTCPFVGSTIRESRFRNHYNAVVVAVARNGVRLHQKIGDIILKPGDVLLVEAHPSFAEQQRSSRDFFLVSTVENSTPPHHEKALIATGLLMMLVFLTTIEVLPVVVAAFLVAGLMILTRCLSVENARKSINWEVLLAIAAAFALGKALEVSGAAKQVADGLLSLAGTNPWLALVIIYFTTVTVTELITNTAAAALMFPFAMATASNLGVNPMPFVIVIMMGASAGFATPIGYQTNLMVYGPGGYRFSDYVRVGLPLDILIGIVTIIITPWIFPF
ncbi:Sodium-dependent dicarboxylate transporter SdcS [Anatilimnocola aggregata]|uniref:Sodium-dependent dicarboxylate transporter SdcS n=1 Tax=Anatilimnocola aggregata TaxID=2528021 RepID=A0A517YLS4_9BACT|nr:SLC13 family permease [Anatilimnocola aggregata]QDU31187.1 Sodium-dependent dicarboxylate transporter SdcS [Anatilimnocola aggregata]